MTIRKAVWRISKIIQQLLLLLLLLLSFTAKSDSEKHNGDEIDDRMLADRLLLQFKSSWEVKQ